MRRAAGHSPRYGTATGSASRSPSAASTCWLRRRSWRAALSRRRRFRSAATPFSTAAKSCRPTAAATSTSCASTHSPQPKAEGRCSVTTLADGRRKVVLLVEDDPDGRDFGASALAQLGHRVLEAADADSAL